MSSPQRQNMRAQQREHLYRLRYRAATQGVHVGEPGGLTMRDAQVVLRGLTGLNLIGGDVCEVSPPLDPQGHTALNGANLMFEILCIVADSVARRKAGR